jgi:hypothetical protein
MLIAGIILIVVAVGALLFARSQRNRVRALASTATVPCNALVADQVCEVIGQARPYEGRALKAPASGRECVWYHHKVTQHWREWERDSDGDMERKHRSRVVEDVTSEADVFMLRDKAGEVIVNPRGASVDDPVQSFNERHDVRSSSGGGVLGALISGLDRRDDEEIEVEEWILPLDEELYVRGKPFQAEVGMTMLDPGDNHFLISTRSEEQLTTSAKRWGIAAAVTAAVCLVAGVALIVAGAVS